MAAAQCISRLGAWEGYEVESDQEVRRRGVIWYVIRLKPIAPVLRCCSGCGEWVESVHDLQERRVRDLPIFESPVELIAPRVRLLRPRCGPKLEHLSWLEPYSRVTVRLAASVAHLCKLMSIQHAAEFYGLAWTTVKLIDKRHLVRELATRANAITGARAKVDSDYARSGFMQIVPKRGQDAKMIARRLTRSGSVWSAYVAPRAVPAANTGADPGSRNVEPAQGYLHSQPDGIGALRVRGVAGAGGRGVKICDIEGNWNLTHEDLPTGITLLGGTLIDTPDWRDHGTAVLGEMVCRPGAVGAVGIVPAAACRRTPAP